MNLIFFILYWSLLYWENTRLRLQFNGSSNGFGYSQYSVICENKIKLTTLSIKFANSITKIKSGSLFRWSYSNVYFIQQKENRVKFYEIAGTGEELHYFIHVTNFQYSRMKGNSCTVGSTKNQIGKNVFSSNGKNCTSVSNKANENWSKKKIRNDRQIGCAHSKVALSIAERISYDKSHKLLFDFIIVCSLIFLFEKEIINISQINGNFLLFESFRCFTM